MRRTHLTQVNCSKKFKMIRIMASDQLNPSLASVSACLSNCRRRKCTAGVMSTALTAEALSPPLQPEALSPPLQPAARRACATAQSRSARGEWLAALSGFKSPMLSAMSRNLTFSKLVKQPWA